LPSKIDLGDKFDDVVAWFLLVSDPRLTYRLGTRVKVLATAPKYEYDARSQLSSIALPPSFLYT
jgi:hypothetical protein